jgi:TRAP-type C4-dicarboxylate transport system permease small subunit
VRRWLEISVYVICLVICAYLAWIAGARVVETLRTGAYETRTFDMPQWLIYLPMAVGLGLSTLEWLRFLLGHDSMYDIDASSMEGF